MRHYTYLSLGLALLAGAFGLRTVAQQPSGQPPDLLRMSRDVKGDSKPVIIAADDVTTWVEGTQRVIVVRGRVLAQQSVASVRFQEGVAWIDLARWKTGILHVDLYAEGQVQLDGGIKGEEGTRALLDLNTRGELKLNAYRGKIRQESLANDPLVARARAARGIPAAAPEIVPAKGTSSSALPSSEIQRTNYQEPIPGPAPVAAPPSISPNSLSFLPPGSNPTADVPANAGGTDAVPVRQSIGETPIPTPGSAPALAPPATARADPANTPSPGVVAPVRPISQAPGPTPLAPPSKAAVPPPSAPVAIEGPDRQYSVAPRNSGINIKMEPVGENQQAIIITGGVILNVRNVTGIGLLDIEADRLVIWTRSLNGKQIVDSMQRPEGQSGRDLEFYLSGNVEIRQQNKKDSRVLRADEVYYDVGRNTAIALRAELEIRDPKTPEGIYVRATQLDQLAANQYKVIKAEIFSSKLPSDPGLTVFLNDATIEDRKVPKFSPFGSEVVDRKTGQQAQVEETRVVAHDATFRLEGVPFFYTPYLAGDAREPFGPLDSLSLGFNNIFGFQSGAVFDVYKLLGIQKYDKTRWQVQVDDNSYRGAGIGTNFDYSGQDIFGLLGSRYEGTAKVYGLYDRAFDRLGGPEFRDQGYDPNGFRGRAYWRQNVYQLPYGLTVQTQLSALSDKNFLEQYYKTEYEREYNQATFLYVKQQEGQFAWTGLVEPRIRDWVTETASLPRLDGYVIGQSFFDLFTYNLHASAGYYELLPTSDKYPSNASLPSPRPIYPNPMDVRNFFPRVSPTDVANRTGRFDVMQELALPFSLGPVRVVPYADLDLAEYTSDLYGKEVGRVWGGGGVRASIPFSRLFPDVQDELFNLNGIFHKITLSGNYFVAGSNEPYSRFAQLDRFNDDATDQSVRDIRLYDPTLYGTAKGTMLATSPVYDPQLYAIRRLIQNRTDTLGDIQVLEFDLLQRWQTKRGYPGAQHVVDWMVLDLSGSYFPAQNRDNFGSSFAFLQYDYLWNIGDRTALTSTGWVDPEDNGAKVYSIGMYFNRPDRTNFYLGYRQIDPLESKQVIANVTYIFSPKYAMTAGTAYDFGTQIAQSNSLVFTRIGTDLQVSLGASYNSILKTFGVTFEIVPVLAPIRSAGPIGAGNGGVLGAR